MECVNLMRTGGPKILISHEELADPETKRVTRSGLRPGARDPSRG